MDFKPIRNRIRTFTYDSLVGHLVDILKRQEGNTSGPSAFWHPLLILKWSLEFAEESYPPKVASRNDVLRLLPMLENLEQAHPTFNLKRNGRMSKTFTILANQQFRYQELPWFDTFARQFVLYHKLKKRYDVEASFTVKTGLSIEDILIALEMLWMGVVKNCLPTMPYYGFISDELARSFVDILGEEKARALFQLFLVSRENIKTVLEEDKKRIIQNYDLQVFETSFFTRKPFFHFKGKIIIPHRDLLNYTINHFIYDYMKSRDDFFSEEFGQRMEKYIELGLVENKIAYLTENNLRDILGRESRVVDFVVEDEILIELKAIELKPYISINPTDDLLKLEMAKTIVKAYAQQMLYVAGKLQRHEHYYGIIITYKELHLGDTNDLWEQFLESEAMSIVGDESILALLPKQNLFFIDLATWDKLMQVVKSNNLSLKKILQEVQKNANEKKFGFYMHLDAYEIKNFDLKYLQVEGRMGMWTR